jgi:phenylacetic acid degradation operon negative regulatory protein
VILDDFDSRPGSATSLLRTFVGAHLREVGGRATIADLITLMGAVGVTAASTRSAVLRVKTKGLLVAEPVKGQPGYRLNADAVAMLERGDRRIYSFRQQRDDDSWCLISYSIPESQRDARHQLRRRLGWIGCGTVATGLWICPAFLVDEVEEILADLQLRDAATLFIASAPRLPGTPAEAAARWWDLDRLAGLHRTFLQRHADAVSHSSDEDAFSKYIRALDDWRVIPYLDPGLPPRALPADWPGFDSVSLFGRLTDALATPASAHVRAVVAPAP